MSRELSKLDSEFRAKYEATLEACEKRGFTYVTFFTLRSPAEQARLWRQGRSTWQINNKISYLNSVGALWLASTLKGVGPQYGRKIRAATPGLSWHHFGEAADSALVTNRRLDWDENAEGYVVLAEEGRKQGLKAGRDFGDSVHLQLRHREPLDYFDWPSLDAELKKRFAKEGEK